MVNFLTIQSRRNWAERARICCNGAAFCALALLYLCAIAWPTQADAQCASYPYTLTNGTVADATQVMGNFTAINNCAAPLANPNFTGNVFISGSVAGYIFNDRTNTSNFWEWYSSGNTAGLYKSFNTAGTVMSMDQNGNVGIGTTSPSRTLHVYSTNGLGFKLENNGTGAAVVEIQSDNNAVTAINFNGSNGGTYGQIVYSQAAGSNYMAFSTNSAERVRIDSSGNVGIGTTAPTYPLQVNGNAFANSWQTPSDARLKKNIAPISDALDTIQRLHGVRFEWRSADEREVGKSLVLPLNQRQIGFIAQDMRLVLPEAVTVAAGPDALMSIQESKIVPVLVEAVKELKAENDSEAREIEALKNEIAEIKRERGIHTATN